MSVAAYSSGVLTVYSSSCRWYLRMAALSVVIPSKKYPAGQSGPPSTDDEDGGRAMHWGWRECGWRWESSHGLKLSHTEELWPRPPNTSAFLSPTRLWAGTVSLLLNVRANFQSQNTQSMKKGVWGITRTMTATLTIRVYFQKQALCQK